jgi:hypothetical protein
MIARALAWLAGIFAVLGGAWLAGKRQGALRAENKALQRRVETQERINDADLGFGATDADRVKRLRDFSDGQR